jgi:hypothetical protein
VALLAEELVEEWLNRQGYFTLRGAKIGVQEMDLLAVRFEPDGSIMCRHVEVQVSVNPQSYLTRLTKDDQKVLGRSATSKGKRSSDVLNRGADAWVAKKFGHGGKQTLLQQLAPGAWTRELVVHRVWEPLELDLLRDRGVTIHFLSDVLNELAMAESVVSKASGSDFLELVLLGSELSGKVPPPLLLRAAIQDESMPEE